MNKLLPIEYNNQRILTTAQLAEGYGTAERRISENYNANKSRYIPGKHYYMLEGAEKREFCNHTEIADSLKNASRLYLWTERGALLHAKSLGTDEAWAVYEELSETYFKVQGMVRFGDYLLPQTLPDALRLAADLAEKNTVLALESAQKDQIIGELKPSADYCDKILRSKGTVPIGLIAKDYGMSARAMNKLLHELGVQFRQSDTWLLYAKYQSKGYTHSKTFDYIDSEERPQVRLTTEWTQKGRLFLYHLLKDNGYLPLIEQDVSACAAVGG